MKVLLIIEHAPDYREAFLRELGCKVDLTVVAQPCQSVGLAPPERRKGYAYLEVPSKGYKGLYWQSDLNKLIDKQDWDVICCDVNLRQIARLFLFIKNKKLWDRWIWRGLIFGQSDLRILGVIRKFIFNRSAGCLVYSEEVARRVIEEYGAKAISFNNTEVKREEFRYEKIDPNHNELRLVFVGTYKPRKRLDRLINLAESRTNVSIRIIGPGMDVLNIPDYLIKSGRVEIFGRLNGRHLNAHFDWADLVVSPGNVGLLVMNAARHGRSIVIDNKSYHGPEYWLAKEAGQPFISFDSVDEVNQFFDDVMENRWKLQELGKRLQDVAKEKYTIEYMAEAHYNFFSNVVERQTK